METSNRRFISTQQLGELLGVTRQTVRNWVVHGHIQAYKIGQNIKIPSSEAVRILEKYEQPIPVWLKGHRPELGISR
jgi:excisionase family DNA binding protein